MKSFFLDRKEMKERIKLGFAKFPPYGEILSVAKSFECLVVEKAEEKLCLLGSVMFRWKDMARRTFILL